MHTDHLGKLLTCRFWFSRSGVGPKSRISTTPAGERKASPRPHLACSWVATLCAPGRLSRQHHGQRIGVAGTTPSVLA